MLLLVLPLNEYLTRLAEPRSIADIALVFLLVYGILKLVRGTRAAPMAAGIAVFALLYWLAVNQALATLEFVLRGALLYIGVAIVVLFQAEIRRALIGFGNRFRLPFTMHRRGEPGENIYDEIALAATTLSSTKTGALIVIERNVGLKSIINGGVKLDAQLSYDLIVAIFNPASPLHDGAVVVIVVSEETGLISFVRRGQIKRALDATKLRTAIFQAIEGRSADRGTGTGAQRRSDETETEEIASA